MNRDVLFKREGFSLVELVVVIAVVAILTGAVAVSVDELNGNTRLSNAATRALADIRYASELAMTHRREVDVYVTAGQDRYEIKWHDTGAYVPSPQGGGDLSVTFGSGDYSGITMSTSGLGGPLSFDSIGAPLISGGAFGNPTSVMLLNSKVHVVVYPSGFVCMEQIVGSGGGCGGC